MQALYHDVSEPQRSTYISKLGVMPAAAYNSYMLHYGWEHFPSTYVYAKPDSNYHSATRAGIHCQYYAESSGA